MLALEWRLTLLGIAILPLFILPARRVGDLLRRITREQMTLNAQMNGMMNETLNVSGALLVKLFGRERDESRALRASGPSRVRDLGIRQALIGRWFFLGLGLVSAIGTALVFWLGGYLVLTDGLTIGTIVAFGAYLTQLYGPLVGADQRPRRVRHLAGQLRARLRGAGPAGGDRGAAGRASTLERVRGEVRFEDVSFSYQAPGAGVELSTVQRWGWRSAAAASDGERDQPRPCCPAAERRECPPPDAPVRGRAATARPTRAMSAP